MARIEIIHEDQAEGQLKEIYDNLMESRGKLANVHKIHSLNPDSLVAHMDLYMTLMFKKSPLKRYQRELLGVITSKNNNCAYCVKHHVDALDFYWKDKTKSNAVADNYKEVELSSVDQHFCAFAEGLTNEPHNPSHAKTINRLKQEGVSDRAILDATMIVAYFNFVNRIVLGLDVEEEIDTGGYNY